MATRPTIKTIAQIAGVSHVAVSKALHGASDISPETTARILKIAKDIGYTPNAAARNLTLKRATTIGMIVPSVEENTAYNVVFNCVSLTAAEHGYCVMLGSSHRSPELEQKHCRMMCENRVGALIVASSGSDVSHIKESCAGLLPVIFIGGKTGLDETYSLSCDYGHSAALVVAHFYDLGHRDIALFSYGPENRTILQKEHGFSQALKEKGLIPRIYRNGMASDTSAAGAQLVERLLAEHALPTAIWCASDLMAMGVLHALRVHGLRVPQDVSVIGHDDLYMGRLAGIELTTLHTPMQELGRAAAELAIAIMNGEAENPHQTFLTRLVVRSTTSQLLKK